MKPILVYADKYGKNFGEKEKYKLIDLVVL
jgi:hypothetical protein